MPDEPRMMPSWLAASTPTVTVVTTSLPVLAATGIVTVMAVAVLAVIFRLMPLRRTDLALPKFRPVITTEVPAVAEVGANPVMVWAEAAIGRNKAKLANAARQRVCRKSEVEKTDMAMRRK